MFPYLRKKQWASKKNQYFMRQMSNICFFKPKKIHYLIKNKFQINCANFNSHEQRIAEASLRR